mmetsp:Transcript_2860/g.5314  ORF Transcript_2860/g.5314 Transcript_2860/m.5314 type:complete len:130 (-) Transcript_2860:238-627(-)
MASIFLCDFSFLLSLSLSQIVTVGCLREAIIIAIVSGRFFHDRPATATVIAPFLSTERCDQFQCRHGNLMIDLWQRYIYSIQKVSSPYAVIHQQQQESSLLHDRRRVAFVTFEGFVSHYDDGGPRVFFR